MKIITCSMHTPKKLFGIHEAKYSDARGPTMVWPEKENFEIFII